MKYEEPGTYALHAFFYTIIYAQVTEFEAAHAQGGQMPGHTLRMLLNGHVTRESQNLRALMRRDAHHQV